MKYGIQIKVNGTWGWAGVEPGEGETYDRARSSALKMAKTVYWTDQVKATHFRVRAIPGSGEPKPGPRAVARAAEARAAELETQLNEVKHQLRVERADRASAKLFGDTMVAKADKLVSERDEARAAAENFAARLGIQVEW